jgi:hypothetical protein
MDTLPNTSPTINRVVTAAARRGFCKSYDVTEGPSVRRINVRTKREAWALDALRSAGLAGCTPIDNPAPRWSGYIHRLRHNHGLNIETVTENHGGEFAGHHARYVLRTTVAPSSEGGAP